LELCIRLPLLGCQGGKAGCLPGCHEAFSGAQVLLHRQIGGKGISALTKRFVLVGEVKAPATRENGAQGRSRSHRG
jgi:hypothetical protein